MLHTGASNDEMWPISPQRLKAQRMQIRVLLADDEAKVRSALRLLLELELGVTVVAEVSKAEGLLAKVRASGPDLVLLDWELPDLAAADLLSALRSLCPQPSVVALSGRPEARQAALAAGADAFISKGDPPERLLATLRSVKAKSEARRGD